MKGFIAIFLIVFTLSNYSQNKPVLYGFAELPQTMSLNPGAETNFKFHVGIPLLSGFSSSFGSNNLVLTDLFLDNDVDFNDKVSTVLNRLSERDYVQLNSQIEVLNGGFRFNDKTYFSFGFYNEIDIITYFPKDIVVLGIEGNAAYLNRSFSLSQLLFKADVLGVLHAGITRKIDKKLTLGARLKIYSSSLNARTNNNSGTFTTVEGQNNIYTQYLHNVNVNIETSGITRNDEVLDNASNIITETFLGGNLGLGLDFGFTYHVTNQLEITGSIIDFGFINYSKNVKNYTAKGSFIFEGINFEYNSENPRNYWQELDDAFKEQLPSEENNISYIAWRPTKINTSLKYSFGEQTSKLCYDNNYKDYFSNAVGVQLFTIFRPLSPQVALTGFYERVFAKKFQAKITYTLDDYSLYNIGAGLSAQIGPVNFYGTVGNIMEYSNLGKANSVSFQVGINLIFN